MNQKTAKMILELASTPGGMYEWATLDAREEIRADLAGKPVHPRDCGEWETWKAIHADLDTPLGSCRTMEAWALQRVGEIAAQK